MIKKDFVIYNILVLGSILIFIIGSIINLDSKLFNCNNLIITGCNLSNEMSIGNQFEYLKNESVFDINKNEIVTKLIGNDFISSAEIAIILPSTILISILEVEPISVIKINNNSFLIDANSNGYLYNDKSSKDIGIPRISIENIDKISKVFESSEYKFLQNIYLVYNPLYAMIGHIENSGNNLIVHLNINESNNKVYFDSNNFYKQTEYLNSFLNILDSLEKDCSYDYIKFSGETIIVKEERNI